MLKTALAAGTVTLAAFGLPAAALSASPAHASHPTATLSTAHLRAAGSHHHKPKVLRVGTYHGKKGGYHSIQAAVDAAKPGDWILVGPGDHKTKSTRAPKAASDAPAGVLITTHGITLRGMSRDKTIVDGTVSGPPCSTRTKDQDFGPKGDDGQQLGRNGIEIWKATNVTVENLTACNFLGPGASDGDTGNEIWWNGGDDSGVVGGHRYWGSYMTATSTYYHGEGSAAQYGIFSSNWNGGTWKYGYASNFNDSGLYIGACRQECNQVVSHIWAEYDALGYSGSNSGGSLVVKHSEFDHNEDGFDTNSQNGDNPPPQNGACPNGAISPITHTHSCWVFMHNNVHNNNNPNVPTAGAAAAGPVGTGMSISGGRNDTVMDNKFTHNKAWGSIFVPYPDSGPPCTGGTQTGAACLYDESGDALLHNKYGHNGGYGNPTNGDYAAVNLEPGAPDCFKGNVEIGGGAAHGSPADAETAYPSCSGSTAGPDLNVTFLEEVACDSGSASLAGVSSGASCLPTDHYPRQTKVVMHPLPGAKAAHGHSALENPASTNLTGMKNPCKGVPANPWCPAHHKHGHKAHGGHGGHGSPYAYGRVLVVRPS